MLRKKTRLIRINCEDENPFPLQALAGVFFVCFMTFLLFLALKRGKKKINKTKNTLASTPVVPNLFYMAAHY